MQLHELNQQLSKSKTTKEIEKIFAEYLNTEGFSSYAFTYYSGHVKSGRKLRFSCVSPTLRSWHEYYLQQTYSDIDRTLEDAYFSTLPLFWDVHEQYKVAKNRREKRMRSESIEFGIDKGLSLSVHGPHNDFVSLTLHQRRGEKNLLNYKKHQFIWLAATQILYHYIRRLLNQSSHQHYHLTKREEQCLALTAKSWRVALIAKELNISERTVNFHLQNANKKLGTNNKYQATYKYFQLIDPDEN